MCNTKFSLWLVVLPHLLIKNVTCTPTVTTMTIENSSQEDLHIEDIHQLDKNVLHQSHQTHGV